MQSLQEYREAGVERFQKKNIAAALGISLPAYDALENDQEHRMNPARAKGASGNGLRELTRLFFG